MKRLDSSSVRFRPATAQSRSRASVILLTHDLAGQTITDPSWLPEAIQRPSALTATAFIQSARPGTGSPICRLDEMFQKFRSPR